MKKALYLTLISFLVVGLFFPLKGTPLHQGSFQGRVIDGSSGEILPGARVYLQDKAQGRLSDDLGRFQFEGLTEGAYQVEVRYLGYIDLSQEIRVFAGKTTQLDLMLSPTALEISGVDIRASRDRGLSTLTRIDLAFRPVQSSQELLRTVPGLLIGQHAGGGKAEQLFLRGFDIDHGTDLALSFDGMPVNMVSHAHGQGYADLHFIIPEVVDRLELRKGPYTVEDGNFATAGAVNLRSYEQLSESRLKLEGNSYRGYRGVALLDLSKDEQANSNAYLASEFLYSDGWFESPQRLQRLNLFGKYRRFLSEDRVLRLSGSAFSSSWDASGQIPQRAIDAGLISRFGAIDDTEGGQTSRYNVNLALDQGLADGSIWENQLSLTRYQFELYSNFTFFLEDSLNGDQIRQKEARNMLAYRSTLKREDQLWGLPLKSKLGGGLRWDDVQGNELSHTANRSETLEQIQLGDVREINAYAFAEGVLDLSDRLRVNAGLRYDQFRFGYEDHLDPQYRPLSQSQGIVSPKLGLDYQATSSLLLYWKGGRGFHSNDSRVVLQNRSRHILPGGWGSDLGFLWKGSPDLLVQGALWYLDLEQEFVYVGDAGIVEPSGQSRRMGLDLSVRWQPLKWMFADLDLNLSLPRAIEEAPGEQFIPLAPTRTSTGGLNFKGDFPLSGSLRYRYLGSRPANEDWSLTAEGYFLLDAHINYDLGSVRLQLSLLNALDQQWNEAQFETESQLQGETEPVSEIHFTPGAPRGVNFGVQFSF